MTRRLLLSLPTLAGLVAILVALGFALKGVGFCLDQINQIIPGATP